MSWNFFSSYFNAGLIISGHMKSLRWSEVSLHSFGRVIGNCGGRWISEIMPQNMNIMEKEKKNQERHVWALHMHFHWAHSWITFRCFVSRHRSLGSCELNIISFFYLFFFLLFIFIWSLYTVLLAEYGMRLVSLFCSPALTRALLLVRSPRGSRLPVIEFKKASDMLADFWPGYSFFKRLRSSNREEKTWSRARWELEQMSCTARVLIQQFG